MKHLRLVTGVAGLMWIVCPSRSKVLGKSLKPVLMSSNFARKMGNGLTDLLKYVLTCLEILTMGEKNTSDFPPNPSGYTAQLKHGKSSAHKVQKYNFVLSDSDVLEMFYRFE